MARLVDMDSTSVFSRGDKLFFEMVPNRQILIGEVSDEKVSPEDVSYSISSVKETHEIFLFTISLQVSRMDLDHFKRVATNKIHDDWHRMVPLLPAYMELLQAASQQISERDFRLSMYRKQMDQDAHNHRVAILKSEIRTERWRRSSIQRKQRAHSKTQTLPKEKGFDMLAEVSYIQRAFMHHFKVQHVESLKTAVPEGDYLMPYNGKSLRIRILRDKITIEPEDFDDEIATVIPQPEMI